MKGAAQPISLLKRHKRFHPLEKGRRARGAFKNHRINEKKSDLFVANLACAVAFYVSYPPSFIKDDHAD